MFKKICALILVLAFVSNCAVLAENWVFTAADQVNNDQQFNIGYPANNSNNQSSDTYYGYAQTADMINNSRPAATVAPAPVVTSTSIYASNPSTTKKDKGTFSENHPILTGLGWGALAVGATALLVVLDGDKKSGHSRHCSNCSTRHSNHHHHYNNRYSSR